MNRIFWLVLLMLCKLTLAVQDSTFGLGGSSTGRVSSVLAEAMNPFAAVFNPALLSVPQKSQFGFSTSFTGYGFEIPESVIRDNTRYRTRSGVPSQEVPDLSVDSQSLWAIGLTYPFSFPFLRRRMGLGFAASGPFQTLRTFTATTPYDFGLLRYGNTENQFKGTLGTSLEILPGTLSAGVGLSLYITAAGSADANLITENPTGRLAFDVGFHTASIVGLFSRLGSNAIAFVYREAIQPTFEQSFVGRVQIERGTGTVDLPATLKTSLYFEPARWELEWQRELGAIVVSAGLAYQVWSSYQAPHLVIESPAADGRTRSTESPALRLRNTWNPRASVTLPLLEKKLQLTSGYAYRPSPVEDLSGPSNLLDSHAHVLGLGVGYRLNANSVLPFETVWSLNGQYHILNRRQIDKTEADSIGAPGYSFRGHAYSVGLSMQAEL